MWTAAQEAEQTEGRGGYEWDGDGDILSWWENNVPNLNLGTEPHAPFAYDLGLENRHSIMSTLEDPRGQLEREIVIICFTSFQSI